MKKRLLISLIACASVSSATAKDSKLKANPGDATKTAEDNIGGEGVSIDSKKSRDTQGTPITLKMFGGTSFNAFMFRNKVRQGGDTKGLNVQNVPVSQSIGKGQGTHFTAEDSRINFEASGVAGPQVGGLEYSFLIGLTGNTQAGKTSVEENRIKLKGEFGTLLLGAHRGVTDFMSVGTYNFIGARGGIFGNYKGVINETTGVLIRDDLMGVAKDQTKATYVTPRFNGFQAGYSYTPNGRHQGQASLESLPAKAGADGIVSVNGKNIHETGVNFKQKYENGLGLDVSLTSVIAASEASLGVRNQYKNASSYAIGTVLSYCGFSVGGEYLDNRNSFKPTFDRNGKRISGNDAGKMYSLGAGYKWACHGVSLAHLQSKKKLGRNEDATVGNYGDLKGDVTSLTYDIKLAQGLKLYAEGVKFNLKASNKQGHANWVRDTRPGYFTTNNNGHAVILGTAISF